MNMNDKSDEYSVGRLGYILYNNYAEQQTKQKYINNIISGRASFCEINVIPVFLFRTPIYIPGL